MRCVLPGGLCDHGCPHLDRSWLSRFGSRFGHWGVQRTAPQRNSAASGIIGLQRNKGTNMQDLAEHADPEHNYSMRFPSTSPSGDEVTVVKGQRDGMHRIHVHTADERTVYFEVVSYPTQIDRDEAAAGQRRSLTERSANGVLSDVVQTVIHSYPALEFRFEGTLQGRDKVRRFLFVESPIRTYRLIYDPRSELNERILDSVTMTA